MTAEKFRLPRIRQADPILRYAIQSSDFHRPIFRADLRLLHQGMIEMRVRYLAISTATLMAMTATELSQRTDQIQLWNSINRLKVSMDVPTNAAEIGSIAAKPAPATTT